MMSLRVRAEFWPSKIGAQPRAGASLLLDSLVMHPQDRTPYPPGHCGAQSGCLLARCALALGPPAVSADPVPSVEVWKMVPAKGSFQLECREDSHQHRENKIRQRRRLAARKSQDSTLHHHSIFLAVGCRFMVENLEER